MICTDAEARNKKCLPISKAMAMKSMCIGSECMAWEWVIPETQENVNVGMYRCSECGGVQTEQLTCHSKLMELVEPIGDHDEKKLTGYCEEIKRKNS